jgi:hypothetical protein
MKYSLLQPPTYIRHENVKSSICTGHSRSRTGGTEYDSFSREDISRAQGTNRS